MAEEKEQSPHLNSDDLSVLNMLLHSVRGISQVSGSTYESATVETEE